MTAEPTQRSKQPYEIAAGEVVKSLTKLREKKVELAMQNSLLLYVLELQLFVYRRMSVVQEFVPAGNDAWKELRTVFNVLQSKPAQTTKRSQPSVLIGPLQDLELRIRNSNLDRVDVSADTPTLDNIVDERVVELLNICNAIIHAARNAQKQ